MIWTAEDMLGMEVTTMAMIEIAVMIMIDSEEAETMTGLIGLIDLIGMLMVTTEEASATEDMEITIDNLGEANSIETDKTMEC